MSDNSAEAKRIEALLQPLPSKMLAAVGAAVYKEVLLNTTQDSGEAAFNWRAQINTSREFPFTPSRGRAPVGSSGEKRTLAGTTEIVVGFRMQEFLARLASIKQLRTLNIYNPIADDDHAFNARLEIARGAATNEGWMDEIAERTLNAHLPKR